MRWSRDSNRWLALLPAAAIAHSAGAAGHQQRRAVGLRGRQRVRQAVATGGGGTLTGRVCIYVSHRASIVEQLVKGGAAGSACSFDDLKYQLQSLKRYKRNVARAKDLLKRGN